MSRYIVGMDGSSGSHRALRWAVNEGQRNHEIEIEAVYAWQPTVYPDVFGAMPLPADPEAEEARATKQLQRWVAEVDTSTLAKPVSLRTVAGLPADVLTEASADADVLVLGALGRGGFIGLLLGSVSERCLSAARCPVAIVRPVPGVVVARPAQPFIGTPVPAL